MIGLQIWIQESSNFWLECSLARIMVVVKDLLTSPNFKSIMIIKAKCFLGSSTTLRRPGRPREEPHLGEWPHLFEFGLSRASQSTWYSHSRSLVLSSIILLFHFPSNNPNLAWKVINRSTKVASGEKMKKMFLKNVHSQFGCNLGYIW